MRIDIVTPDRDELGESPVWDGRTGRLFRIDSRRHLVRACRADGSGGEAWTLPGEIGSIALCDSGRLLVALEATIGFLDLGNGGFAPLATIAHPAQRMRLNDGRIDRAGRFCVGSLVLGRREPLGRLYRLDADGGIAELDQGFCTANTTCFSPDGRWMYCADSHAGEIWRYAYDGADGRVGPREVFVDRVALGGAPDGATVDAAGFLWVALVLSGDLARISPDGVVERRISLPVPYPSCPCIGGDDLDTIYVTTIRNSGNALKSDHQDSGALLAIRGAGVVGLPEMRFADAALATNRGGKQ